MIGVIVVPAGFDAETPVAGLRPLLRVALAMQAAGVDELRFVGAAAAVPRDRRLTVPGRVGLAHARGPALVVRADATCHRALLPRLARAADAAPLSLTVARGGEGVASALACVAGERRLAEVAHALWVGGPVGPHRAVGLMPGEFLVAARTPSERARAETLHLASLVKPTAGVLDRWIMRPVSLRISRRLAPTRVTPNQVTAVSLLLALGAALLVALGGVAGAMLGAALHVVVRFVDCVDGELARLRHEQSKLGEWFDTVADGVGIAALIAATTWRAINPANPGTSTGFLAGEMRLMSPDYVLLGGYGALAWALVKAMEAFALARRGDGGGSVQAILWGHRQAEPRTWPERAVKRLEVLFRIDVISVVYAALVATGAFAPLLFLHALCATGAATYFAAQLFSGTALVDPARAR